MTVAVPSIFDNTMNQYGFPAAKGNWIRAGVPSRAWIRDGLQGGTSVEKHAEARRRLILEEREALIQVEMTRIRKEAKESR